ncbi:beta strand repeat-containing protein [Alteromonas mediterranea]|uniref:beta strand repeat-containing protein n=1 Tax=Alteromonas mediterranea TaxID=314275 RepID=UPI00040F0CA8|nr:retention module-containing protein [Alteromonas mediterranea]
MADVSIVEVNGEASLVRSETGEQINAVSGMAVNEGDVLNISPDATVTVSVNGELRTLPAGQTVSFPLQLDFTDSNTDDEFAVFDESVDELAALLDGVKGTESASQENGDFLDVLAGEGDILESLEATAAGLDGGAGTGGGSNFVRVDRINEDVDPVGFQFEQNNNNNDDITPTEFSGTGEQAQDISLTLDPIGLTNDTTPTITGITSAIPGSTVTFTVTDSEGNTQTLTAIVQDDGTFSADVPNALADGDFTVDATVLEPTGNTADGSTTDQIDATAPTIIINAPGSDNDTTPTLTGTTDATPGSTVTLTDSAGNTQTVTAIVQADGTYSADVPAELAEGEFTINASVTDEAGNTDTDTGTLVIDTTAPTVAINDLTTNDTTPELTGTVNDPNAIVVVTIDGNDYTATNNGTWTLADDVVATLAEGSYPTSVSATDAAGNTVTNSGTVVIDTTAPTVAINDLTTNDTTPELTGTVNDPNAVVVVTIDGNDYTATNNGNGTWTLADDVVATLAEGSYPTSVSATDTTAPTVAINDLTTNDTTPELTGTVNDPNAVVVVTIDGNDYTATNNGNGTWTLADNIVALLAEGNYTATVTATDAVGNSDSATGSIVIDTSIDENNNGQTVTFDSISNDSGVAGDFITSDSTLIFNGTVDLGDNTTLTVTVDGTSYTFGTDPELTIDGSGNWSLDLTGTPLPAGTYAVVATVTDEVGNSASTASQNVVVQALDAINDGNAVDMGEPVVTVNPPETTSNDCGYWRPCFNNA